MKRLILFFILLSVFSACQEHPLQQLGLTSVSQKTDEYVLKGTSRKVVDILFVIDNSASMREEQEKIARNIVKFMEELKKKGDRTDYQIGVITTSLYIDGIKDGIPQGYGDWVRDYEDGRLQVIVTELNIPQNGKIISSNTDHCKRDPNGKRFLTNADEQNIVELLSNTIQCTSTNGANIERGLDAIKKSLSDPRINNENKGFLRDDASLMIIVLSDEDDCSFADGTVISDGKYCIERYNPWDEGYNTRPRPKDISYYTEFLGCLKNKTGCDSCVDSECLEAAVERGVKSVGFAAIVGPEHGWTGSIDDMGHGPHYTPQMSYPPVFYPLTNCSFVDSLNFYTFYDNYIKPGDYCNTCADDKSFSDYVYDYNFGKGINDDKEVICSCEEGAADECNKNSFFTTCFNNEQGIPNKLQFEDPVNSCSEKYLNGNCKHRETEDQKYHCAVTSEGVKCVANDCSPSNLNGTCSPGEFCDNGECKKQQSAVYSKDNPLLSDASAGKRYLEIKKAIENLASKDTYNYSICLQDFGTPLSLIGAKLADAKCEYSLDNYTDDPCTLIIEIAPPEGDELPEGLKPRTSLGNPWTYIVDQDKEEELFNLSPCSDVASGDTYSCLKKVCEDDLKKPYSSRNGILQYLTKVDCKDGSKNCINILFPEETGICPQPGSSVKIYYGVSAE